jgi:hypothetical protein
MHLFFPPSSRLMKWSLSFADELDVWRKYKAMDQARGVIGRANEARAAAAPARASYRSSALSLVPSLAGHLRSPDEPVERSSTNPRRRVVSSSAPKA